MPRVDAQLEKFRRQLRILKFPFELDYNGIILGSPAAFAKFYRHLLCDYNPKLTQHLIRLGFDFPGCSDYRLMEILYRMARDLFNMRPVLSLTQYYSTGFVERKLEFATLIAIRVEELVCAISLKTKTAPSLQRKLRSEFSYGLSSFAKRRPVLSINKRPASSLQLLSSRSSGKLDDEFVPPFVPTQIKCTDPVDARPSCSKGDRSSLVSTSISLKPVLSDCDHVFQSLLEDVDTGDENNCNRRSRSRSARHVDPSAVAEQQNQCATFSTSVPNVAQLDQLCQPSQHGSTKSSKPHQTSRGCHSKSNTAYRSSSLVRNLSTTVNSVSAARSASMRRPHTDALNLNGILPHEAMQDIMNTLNTLSGKVDAVLKRMDQLESRLPAEHGRALKSTGLNEVSGALLRSRQPDHLNTNETSVGDLADNSARERPLPRTSTEVHLPSPTSTFISSRSATTFSWACMNQGTNQPRTSIATSQPPVPNPSFASTTSRRTTASPTCGSFNFKDFERDLPLSSNNTTLLNRDCVLNTPVNVPAAAPASIVCANMNCPPHFDSVEGELGEVSYNCSSKESDKPSWPTSTLASATSYGQPNIPFHTTYGRAEPARFHPDAYCGAGTSSNNCAEQHGDILESYRSQTDRIMSMLTKTQGLLSNTQSPVAVSGTF